MPRRAKLTLRGHEYGSQKLLSEALTASARAASKCYRRGRFSAASWRFIDPEAYSKAVELGLARRILADL